MSIHIMSQVWADSTIKKEVLLTLLAIADFANDEGLAWPSVDTLATKTRSSQRTVQRTISALVETGLLEVIPQGGQKGTNLYRITLNRGDKMTGGGDKPRPRMSPGGVTSMAKRGDTAMSPESSGTTNIEPSRTNTIIQQSLSIDVGKIKIPQSLDNEQFKSSWKDWEDYRKQRKIPMTPIAISRTLKKLEELGLERAIIAIDHSIRNHYRGVYEPREFSNPRNATPPPSERDYENSWGMKS